MLLSSDDMTILSCLKVSLADRMQHKPTMDYASRDVGGSQDFNDYQSFSPGENLRHVDWNRYMRDSTLFTRQYEKTERPEICVVPDLSRSIAVSQKEQAVKYITASLCFCLLNKGMTVRLLSDAGLERYSGQAGWQRIHHDIEVLEAGNNKMLTLSSLASSLPKHVIVVSDLICSDGVEQFQKNINIGNRRALLINLSSDLDRNPELSGNLRLQDAQNDRGLPCYVDRQMKERYRTCRTEYYRRVESYCMTMNWRYKEMFLENDLKQQLSYLAPSGTLYI